MATSIFDKIISEASEYVLIHHVSLGGCYANPGKQAPYPDGSGTLVRIMIDGRVVYGILTAAHVARWLKLGMNREGIFLSLSKPQGIDSINCLVNFQCIYYDVEYSLDRFHNHSNKEGFLPDLALIILGLDCHPDCELLHNSKFFNLDANQEFPYTEDPCILSIFFRGACADYEISADGYMATFLYVGGGEFIKSEKNIQYWKIPNDSGKSFGGVSGAALWRFRYEEGELKKSLGGVVISEDYDYSFLNAIAFSYLYESFLPKLKVVLRKEFGHIG